MLKKFLCPLLLVLTQFSAFGGGSGLNVVVVVNQNSADSVQLGNEYCAARGVPPQNFFRITNWTGGSLAWSKSDFEGYLQNPLLASLAASGSTGQVNYVLLSMDIPYRVVQDDSGNGTTSVLFYGFKTNSPVAAGLPTTCSLPDFSSNSFAFSELPYDKAMPDTAITNSFLSFMLTDNSLAGAEAILNRGVASDSSFPTQTVYLEKTSDTARNVRFFSFDNAIFESRIRKDPSLTSIISDATSLDNTRGLLTGLATFSVPADAFVPGSLSDSLTSFGGELFENSGQTPLLAFLDAGAAASYGAVVEPCNYPQKFPDPMAYIYQARGFSAAEAYYQSLENPYQGLLVGEPLSAPFAVRAQGDWAGLTNGTVLSGQVSLPQAAFAALPGKPPLSQVDLFVDGAFFNTVTNIFPVAGQALALTINGVGLQYTVPNNAIVSSVVTGLAALANSNSNATRVVAIPYGDRLEFQGLDVSASGSNLLLSASAPPGSAISLAAAQTSFLDTEATGYLVLTVTNPTAAGDWLTLTVIKTNGATVNLSVTNSGTATVADLCGALMNSVSAAPDLQGADGIRPGELYPDVNFGQFILYSRSPGWLAAQVQSTLTASTNLAVTPVGRRTFESNLSDLRPRNHLYAACGSASISFQTSFDTSRIPDGFHELTLVAYEGTSVRSQTHLSRTVQIHNTPLAANLMADTTRTNSTIDASFGITVAANATNISTIELFSTGGSIGIVSNQTPARFSVPNRFLGVGSHPLYALVTDVQGNKFRTRSILLRVLPAFNLAISSGPLALSWSSAAGASYDILSSADLSTGFVQVDQIIASGATFRWPIPSGASRSFYRVRLGSW